MAVDTLLGLAILLLALNVIRLQRQLIQVNMITVKTADLLLKVVNAEAEYYGKETDTE